MFGWINDCTEQLVLSKFGVEAWHEIKRRAGCDVKDRGFVRHEYYPDSSTVDLVVAASEVLGLPVDGVLEAFGTFFMEFVRREGYENLLNCQGSTLRLWLSNLNAMHDHLQSSLPEGFVAPVFWCEDYDLTEGDDGEYGKEGSILLHYYSRRGSLLVPLVVGVVREVARFHFDVDIGMERLATQGEDGSEFTTWRLYATDPELQWKLTREAPEATSDAEGGVFHRRATMETSNAGDSDSDLGSPSMSLRRPQPASSNGPLRCPFSSMALSIPPPLSPNPAAEDEATTGDDEDDEEKKQENFRSSDYFVESGSGRGSIVIASSASASSRTTSANRERRSQQQPRQRQTKQPFWSGGLSAERMRSVFPYHVLVDRDFAVLQVGRSLPALLFRDVSDITGRPIGSILRITRPVLGGWNWPTLHKLADQTFFLTPLVGNVAKENAGIAECGGEKGGGGRGKAVKCSLAFADRAVKFKGNMVEVSDTAVMFVLSPDAKNVAELSAMGLTMSDLPLHSFQRDAVFLGEHIASEVRSAHKLDRLSKKLENEKNLSNTLLYNMLPRSVADELRSGRMVEPSHYENVTLFFSDVVGFTSICDRIEPWDVIHMLNQLYTVMDHLAEKFGLYKVETIGDAYMCCSGLPIPDERHAENIADFAIAVMECVKHVVSPADGEPLQLRIGIHTGHCMGGVVGTLTPHYCLFGDMINTTARHESTGLSGRIQCSSVLYGQLRHFSVHRDCYRFTPRGLVPMKGKGECYTYWLEGGTEHNARAGPAAVHALYEEVGQVLGRKKWRKRRYFRRGSMYETASTTDSEHLTMFDGSSYTRSVTSTESLELAAAMEAAGTDLGEEFHSFRMGQGAEEADPGSVLGAGSEANAGSDCESNAEEREKRLAELDELLESVELQAGSDLRSDSAEGQGTSGDGSSDGSRPMCWSDIGWDPSLNREDLVENVHELMLRTMKVALGEDFPEDRLEPLSIQLYGFVQRISMLYRNEVRFHNWRHACHVVMAAQYLMDVAQVGPKVPEPSDCRLLEGGMEDSSCGDSTYLPLHSDPWLPFVAAFTALIHDAKHLGVTNRQLELNNHVICQVYDRGSCQERQSLQIGMGILTEEFPELSREVLRGCPMFFRLVTSAVLATDISSRDAQRLCREKFERVISCVAEDEDAGAELALSDSDQRTEAALEQIILLADVGHCSQDYETFLRWNRAFYEECLVNYLARQGDDPRDGWYEGQIGFLEKYVLPLAERCERFMPPQSRAELCEGVKRIKKRWCMEGMDWTDKMIEELAPGQDGMVHFRT